MGRPTLSASELMERYQSLKENLDYYKEQRSRAMSDDEKNAWTRKISEAKSAINSFKYTYKDRLFINERPTSIPLKKQSNAIIKEKLREIEIKAEKLLKDATTDQERKSIQERLEAVRLRAKYAFV